MVWINSRHVCSLVFVAAAALAWFPRFSQAQFCSVDSEPEACKNTPELIKLYGYPFENHTVTSQGYQLQIQRIPKGKNPSCTTYRPVLIHHGVGSLSRQWVNDVYSKLLPFNLTNVCYDVWLLNARGTSYGNTNDNISNTTAAFWAFDFHEMGKYDAPAIVDYVLTETGASKVQWVGHSMGTTIALVMLATRPEYNVKVDALFLLAPIATISNATNTLTYIAFLSPILQFPFSIAVYTLSLNMLPIQLLFILFCQTPSLLQACSLLIMGLESSDANGINMTRLPVYLYMLPNEFSTQTYVHYFQIYNSKKFQMFDYSASLTTTNMAVYGQSTPPLYNLQNIQVPTYLYVGNQDTLSSVPDVTWLCGQLGTYCEGGNYTLLQNFTHLTFTWGIGSVDPQVYLFPQLISAMTSRVY